MVKEVVTASQIVSIVLVPLVTGLCGVGIALAFKVNDCLSEIQIHLTTIEKSVSILQTRYEIESGLWNNHLKGK